MGCKTLLPTLKSLFQHLIEGSCWKTRHWKKEKNCLFAAQVILTVSLCLGSIFRELFEPPPSQSRCRRRNNMNLSPTVMNVKCR